MLNLQKFHRFGKHLRNAKNVTFGITNSGNSYSIHNNLHIKETKKLLIRNFTRSACLPYNINMSTECEKIDDHTFEKVCEETLESLTDFFEELLETRSKLESADVSYSSGVLTAKLGKYGTYVINRQSPNKQIWLSSPISGPKRYDYVPSGSYWIYRHEMKSLHELLETELTSLLEEDIDLSKCLHSKT